MRKAYLIARRYGGRLPAWWERRHHGIVAVPPCYYVRSALRHDSIVVDCGTGADPNFSLGLMRQFGVRSTGFEPTRKHHRALDAVVAATDGRFTYRPLAIGARRGRASFYESCANVSGSFLTDHVNVRTDKTEAYDVETVGVDDLFDVLGVSWIDVLKLDIEGAEYEALAAASDDALRGIGQLIVEFHDHCVPRYSPWDTRRIVRRLQAVGFRMHVVDGIDFLFFRV